MDGWWSWGGGGHSVDTIADIDCLLISKAYTKLTSKRGSPEPSSPGANSTCS